MIKKTAYTSILLLLIFSFAQGEEISQPIDDRQEPTTLIDNKEEEIFLQATKQQQKILPKKVNSFITWTDITLEGKNIIYIYLVNQDELNLPLSWAITELKTMGKPNILRGIKSNNAIRYMLGRGYTFLYRYYDKEKILLHEFTIDQKDLT